MHAHPRTHLSALLAIVAGVTGAVSVARADGEIPGAPELALATVSTGAAAANGGEGEERRAADEQLVSDKGLLDAREIALEMSRRAHALGACYERELRHHPELRGTVELRFTVGKDGTVRHAHLDHDRIKSRALGRCLVSRVEGARFPVPLGGRLEFSYPLRFQPGK